MIQNGNTVVITGASDGLGKAIALELAKKYDLNFSLCGRNREKLELCKVEIQEINSNSSVYIEAFNLLDEIAIKQYVSNTITEFKQIDYLINNAGANTKKALVEEIDLTDFRYMMELNCISHLAMIQQVYPAMRVRRKGQIIDILSSVCLFSNETMASYTASKQAMNAVHKILAKEAREHNVMITGIYPGGIDTHFRAVERHDYMSVNTVATAIIHLMELEDDAIPQELVMRPFVETNY